MHLAAEKHLILLQIIDCAAPTELKIFLIFSSINISLLSELKNLFVCIN